MLDDKFVIEKKEFELQITTGKKIQIIDIREKISYNNPIKTSEWISASELLKNKEKIKKNIPVILYCDTGVVSFCVANILHEKYKFNNIYSLKGGINNLR